MYQRILVPFDGSATSLRGLDEAVKVATRTGGRLRLLCMVDDLICGSGFETTAVCAADWVESLRTAGEQLLGDGRARAEGAGATAETVLVEGVAPRLADAVAAEVETWGADLIVIGTHGRRGIGRLLLGSDAEQILRSATVPVLLVRGAGAGSAAPEAPAHVACETSTA